jgi:hypothetical protein
LDLIHLYKVILSSENRKRGKLFYYTEEIIHIINFIFSEERRQGFVLINDKTAMSNVQKYPKIPESRRKYSSVHCDFIQLNFQYQLEDKLQGNCRTSWRTSWRVTAGPAGGQAGG